MKEIVDIYENHTEETFKRRAANLYGNILRHKKHLREDLAMFEVMESELFQATELEEIQKLEMGCRFPIEEIIKQK